MKQAPDALRLRVIAICSSILIALSMTQVGALGIGDAEILSHLGSPLLIKVPLTGESGEVLDRRRLALVPFAHYRALGLIPPPGGSEIKTRTLTENGNTYLMIESEAPMKEPLFDLAIEARGNRFASTKHVSVLLDLPRHSAQSSPKKKIQSPTSQDQRHSVLPAFRLSTELEQQAAFNRSKEPRTDSRSTLLSGNTYGPVRSGETLSHIAERIRPKGSQLWEYTLALAAANPEKVNKDGTNLLLGAVLELPTNLGISRVSAGDELTKLFGQNGDPADEARSTYAQMGSYEPAIGLDDEPRLIPASFDSRNGLGGDVRQAKHSLPVRTEIDRLVDKIRVHSNAVAELRLTLERLTNPIKHFQPGHSIFAADSHPAFGTASFQQTVWLRLEQALKSYSPEITVVGGVGRFEQATGSNVPASTGGKIGIALPQTEPSPTVNVSKSKIPTQRTNNGWLWLALSVIAVLALGYFLRSRSSRSARAIDLGHREGVASRSLPNDGEAENSINKSVRVTEKKGQPADVVSPIQSAASHANMLNVAAASSSNDDDSLEISNLLDEIKLLMSETVDKSLRTKLVLAEAMAENNRKDRAQAILEEVKKASPQHAVVVPSRTSETWELFG